jgi:hypothetical protein
MDGGSIPPSSTQYEAHIPSSGHMRLARFRPAGRVEDAAHGVHGSVTLDQQPPSVVTRSSALGRSSARGVGRDVALDGRYGYGCVPSTFEFNLRLRCRGDAGRVRSGHGPADQSMIEPLFLPSRRSDDRWPDGGSGLVARARNRSAHSSRELSRTAHRRPFAGGRCVSAHHRQRQRVARR